MRGDTGKSKEIVQGKIAVADRIETICRDAGKTKFAGNCVAVNRE